MIASDRRRPAPRLLAGWLLALSLLSGCLGSVANPTLVASPSPGFETSRVGIGEVSAAADRGVVMTKEDLERISHRVEADLAASYPDRVVKPGDAPLPDMVNVKLVFTEYDKGNAFARLMLAGLEQIRIGANVVLIDPANNQTVGEFEVSKDFSFGGLYGGATSVEDVEDGFARSVAAIFKQT
jgi:hypothetical protein